MGGELGLSTAVDGSDHVAEGLHADVETTGISEEAVVEGLLVLLGVGGCVSDALSVLVFGVASPHGVDRLLAGQEVVGTLL